MKGFNANKSKIIEGETFSDCSQKSLVKKGIAGKNYFIILISLGKRKKKKNQSEVGQTNQFSFVKINKSMQNMSEFTRQERFASSAKQDLHIITLISR